MPHTFTNRPRKFANWFTHPDQLGLQFRWEHVNAFSYEVGGLLFVVASVLQLPMLSQYNVLSKILIVLASVCFLIVSLHDALEFHTLGKDISRRDFVAIGFYILGSLCLMVGSIYSYLWFVQEADKSGYLIFMFGSISFIFGSVLNSLNIFESPTRRTAQYFLLTAICFIIGSTMFLVGSAARYTITYANDRDAYNVNTFVADFYIAGSILFCLGGMFNSFRFSIVMKRDIREYNTRHPLRVVENMLGIGTPNYGSMDGISGKSGNDDDDDDKETHYESDRDEDLNYFSGSSGKS